MLCEDALGDGMFDVAARKSRNVLAQLFGFSVLVVRKCCVMAFVSYFEFFLC